MKYDLSKYLGSNYKGIYIGDFIKKKYDEKIPVFHLVGGLDKLRRSELDASDPKDDLPNTLDEWIEKDGLICLKVKLKGTDLDWDINRTLEVVNIAHEIKDRAGNSTLYFSADTNEQCEHPDYIVEYLRKIREKSERAYRELLYVEQPTERDLRLHRFDMTKAAALKPVILDESLTSLEDLKLARSLGWSGIALKACKCQTHSLIFASMAEKEGFPYTVQDLTNIGISLIQSVGLAARLNPMMGVEANSRQFFPDASKPEAAVHPGIYTRKDGMLDTGSMKGFGLGYQIEKINRKLG
jgi:L-alanine-DL-glutamate epimerase-like enolase superfamily enzyme